MTRSIEDSPLVERTLLIQGHVSDATRRDLARGLPARIAGNEAILFVGYNYADVPVGSSFDCCYMSDDESLVRYVRSELVAVTQQFAEPWSEIPHGWRTIVVLAFHDAIPDLVAALPQEDDWSISDQAADLVAKDLASATATASGCRRRPAPCVPGWCSRGGLSTVAPTPGRRHVGATAQPSDPRGIWNRQPRRLQRLDGRLLIGASVYSRIAAGRTGAQRCRLGAAELESTSGRGDSGLNSPDTEPASGALPSGATRS